MISSSTLPDLGATVLRWRRTLYGFSVAGMLVFALVGADPKAIAATILFALAWAMGAETDGDRTSGVLLADLGVSVSVWWLYGPITGAAFVAFGVVALGPFLLTRLASRSILVAALVTVPVRIVLHFAAGEVELPLFHPDDPVPTSEFLIGETIQAVFLLGVSMLMIRIAEMLRRGQEAMALDLDRQREINALKDRFVATVSHELRTPLTSLKGFTRTLLEDDHSPEERQEFLLIMTDQTEELHALIEDLITFSRIEAGGITIKPLKVKLRGLVQDVVSGLGQRAATVSN
ncbi:MAG: sensor histidine kinase [Acidimicrobiia bacterium]